MKSFSRISHQFVSDDKYQMLERKINYAGNLHINYTVMARKGSGGIWDFILNLPMASASPKGSSFELLYVHSYIYVHCFFFSFFLAFALSFFFFSFFLLPFFLWKNCCYVWFVEIRMPWAVLESHVWWEGVRELTQSGQIVSKQHGVTTNLTLQKELACCN